MEGHCVWGLGFGLWVWVLDSGSEFGFGVWTLGLSLGLGFGLGLGLGFGLWQACKGPHRVLAWRPMERCLICNQRDALRGGAPSSSPLCPLPPRHPLLAPSRPSPFTSQPPLVAPHLIPHPCRHIIHALCVP